MRKIIYLLLIFILILMVTCVPSAKDCETGNSGSFIVAVFNSSTITNYSGTCNLQSAVDTIAKKTTQLDKKSISENLLQLRSESEKYNNVEYIPSQKNKNYVVGDKETFDGTEYTLKQQRTHCDVWLRTIDDDGDNGQGGDIEDTDTDSDGVSLNDYANYFNDHSWQDLYDNFTTNIPDKINILFEDMGDSPAGYYSGGDKIRLNTIVAQNGTINNYMEPNPLFTNGTLTHEFQHLVHAYNNCYFDIWVNEMLSCTAESIWAGQSGIYIDFYNERAEVYNEVSLITWSSPDHRDRYSIASIFGMWLCYQAKNGTDKGVFLRKLYENKGLPYLNSLYIVVKTACDVGIYSDSVDFQDDNSVKTAWAKIFSDFLGAMILNEPTGKHGFNGAWDELNPLDPDTDEPVKPEIYLYKAKAFSLISSAFCFVKTDKEITEVDNNINYIEFEY